MSPSTAFTRRGLIGASAAVGAGAGFAALTGLAAPAHAAGTPTPTPSPTKYQGSGAALNTGGLVTNASPLPDNKLVWSTYGDWLEQRLLNARNTSILGRVQSLCARETKNTRGSYDLLLRYDRAEANAMRISARTYGWPQPTDAQIADTCWMGAAWCSDYNAPAKGLWEVDVTMPSRAGLTFALMLWPQDGSLWPFGEIDLLEAVTGSGQGSNNLHFYGPNKQDAFDQRIFSFNCSGKHRYGVDVQSGYLDFYIDGTRQRRVTNSQVPYGTPSHLVLQIGADRAVLGPGGSMGVNYSDNGDFYYEEKATVVPLKIPG